MARSIIFINENGNRSQLELPADSAANGKPQLFVSDGVTTWELTPSFEFQKVPAGPVSSHLVINSEGKIEWATSKEE